MLTFGLLFNIFKVLYYKPKTFLSDKGNKLTLSSIINKIFLSVCNVGDKSSDD